MARRRKERPPFSGGIAFGELMAIFQPGVEHLIEEQERKRTELVVPGDADNDWDIDLDGRVATLSSSAASAPESSASDARDPLALPSPELDAADADADPG